MGLDTLEWHEANGETNGSTSTAPLAISRSTFSRQHQPKDLSSLHRDIYLMEIKYCEDTRQQDQLSATQEQHKVLCSLVQEPPLLPSTPSFWEWLAPSTTTTRWSLFRSWVLIQRAKKLASKLHVHCAHYAAKLVYTRRALSSTVTNSIRRRFQVKPATLLIPIDPFLILFGGGFLR